MERVEKECLGNIINTVVQKPRASFRLHAAQSQEFPWQLQNSTLAGLGLDYSLIMWGGGIKEKLISIKYILMYTDKAMKKQKMRGRKSEFLKNLGQSP